MGMARTVHGLTGEYLFGERAGLCWGATFRHEPEAPYVDGYLHWPGEAHFEGVILWVQIKAHLQANEAGSFEVYIANPAVLREWKARGVILVVCDLEAREAWWGDTWRMSPTWTESGSAHFQVSRSQPVACWTKKAIRKAALMRPHKIVLRAYSKGLHAEIRRRQAELWLPSEPTHGKSMPPLGEAVEAAYGLMSSSTVLERNAIALSVARHLMERHSHITADVANEFIYSVIERLLSRDWGGRSYTLGALLLLLNQAMGTPIGAETCSQLTHVIEHALTSSSFLNPEFALLAAGFVDERFGETRSECGDLLREMAQKQAVSPRSPACHDVAKRMLSWIERRETPLERYFPESELLDAIVRPLPLAADVLADPEDAKDRAVEIMDIELAQRRDEQNYIYDEYIRFLADEEFNVPRLVRLA